MPKGSDRVGMVVKLRVQYCRDFFWIHIKAGGGFADMSRHHLQGRQVFRRILKIEVLLLLNNFTP